MQHKNCTGLSGDWTTPSNSRFQMLTRVCAKKWGVGGGKRKKGGIKGERVATERE